MSNGGIIGPNVVINGQTTTQTFTASGTFTSRSNQQNILVAIVAGGSGGGADNGGGGGAGGMILTPISGIPMT